MRKDEVDGRELLRTGVRVVCVLTKFGLARRVRPFLILPRLDVVAYSRARLPPAWSLLERQ